MTERNPRGRKKALRVMKMMLRPDEDRAEELHRSAKAFLLGDRSLLKTKVGACYQDDCVNNHREEHICKLPEITIGTHPISRGTGCMQYALDYDYIRRTRAYGKL